ncbi:hypothetical protein Tco_1447272 [Tanacetum coccineum]
MRNSLQKNVVLLYEAFVEFKLAIRVKILELINSLVILCLSVTKSLELDIGILTMTINGGGGKRSTQFVVIGSGAANTVGIKSFIRLFGITGDLIKVSVSQEERNKPEIEILSLDELFNNLKAYESEVKGTSNSTTNSHNVAFLSSSSTNSATRAVNTAQDVNTASTQGAVDSSTTVENLVML